MNTLGLDCSFWQGPNVQYPAIDWTTVKAGGVMFAFMRACRWTYVDPTFGYNWAESERAGVLRGAYCYFNPTVDPLAQAETLYDLTGGAGELPDVLDFESNPANYTQGTLRNRLDQCRDRYVQLSGRQPILYTNLYWLSVLGDTMGMDLWIARYNTEPGIDDWVFWQDSQTTSFPGIADPTVDRDWFNGTYEDLLVYCGLEPEEPTLTEKVGLLWEAHPELHV